MVGSGREWVGIDVSREHSSSSDRACGIAASEPAVSALYNDKTHLTRIFEEGC